MNTSKKPITQTIYNNNSFKNPDMENTQQTAGNPPAPEIAPSAFAFIFLDQIVESETNPRKDFAEDAMADLISSVREKGIIQPILLRPLIGEMYEVVCGARRFRAAQAVFQTDKMRDAVPAYIRNLTDDEVLELQIIENLQRRDVHPMEEAAAIEAMSKKLTLEQIGDRIGKSMKYVSGRLRLMKLSADWQKLFYLGKISFEEARVISRLDESSQQIIWQDRALFDGGEPRWTREDWHLGQINYLLRGIEHDLAKARFDTEDPTLFPEMGVCSTCPFNTAANNLFADVDGAICTKAACFDTKTRRNDQRIIHAAAQIPGTVLVTDYVYTDSQKAQLEEARKVGFVFERYTDFDRIPVPKPVLDMEKYIQEESEGDTSEEMRHVLEKAHRELVAEREAKLAEVEALVASGSYRRGVVVTGYEIGDCWYIKLKQKTKVEDAGSGEPVAGLTDAATVEYNRLVKKEEASADRDKVRLWEALRDFGPERYSEHVDFVEGNVGKYGALPVELIEAEYWLSVCVQVEKLSKGLATLAKLVGWHQSQSPWAAQLVPFIQEQVKAGYLNYEQIQRFLFRAFIVDGGFPSADIIRENSTPEYARKMLRLLFTEEAGNIENAHDAKVAKRKQNLATRLEALKKNQSA